MEIKAPPGFGKTAFIAELQHRQLLSCVHFCDTNAADSLDPVALVESLAAQLAERSPAFAETLPSQLGLTLNATQHIASLQSGHAYNVLIRELHLGGQNPLTLFRQCIASPLQQANTKPDVVIAIDAVDICRNYPFRPSIPDLVESAFEFELPIKWIVTARTPQHFAHRKCRQLKMTDYDDYVQQDIAGHIRTRMKRPPSAEQHATPEELAQRCKGSFLYASRLCALLESDPSAAFEELVPGDMAEYYFSLLSLLAKPTSDLFPLVRRVLGVLVVAQSPLDVSEIAFMAEASELDCSAVLQKLLPVLRIDAESSTPKYKIFHQSLADYLVEETHDYTVTPIADHRRIAARYVMMHQSQEAIDRYGLSFAVYHMSRGNDLRHLPALIDHRWIAQKGAKIETGYFDHVREMYQVSDFLRMQVEANALPVSAHTHLICGLFVLLLREIASNISLPLFPILYRRNVVPLGALVGLLAATRNASAKAEALLEVLAMQGHDREQHAQLSAFFVLFLSQIAEPEVRGVLASQAFALLTAEARESLLTNLHASITEFPTAGLLSLMHLSELSEDKQVGETILSRLETSEDKLEQLVACIERGGPKPHVAALANEAFKIKWSRQTAEKVATVPSKIVSAAEKTDLVKELCAAVCRAQISYTEQSSLLLRLAGKAESPDSVVDAWMKLMSSAQSHSLFLDVRDLCVSGKKLPPNVKAAINRQFETLLSSKGRRRVDKAAVSLFAFDALIPKHQDRAIELALDCRRKGAAIELRIVRPHISVRHAPLLFRAVHNSSKDGSTSTDFDLLFTLARVVESVEDRQAVVDLSQSLDGVEATVIQCTVSRLSSDLPETPPDREARIDAVKFYLERVSGEDEFSLSRKNTRVERDYVTELLNDEVAAPVVDFVAAQKAEAPREAMSDNMFSGFGDSVIGRKRSPLMEMCDFLIPILDSRSVEILFRLVAMKMSAEDRASLVTKYRAVLPNETLAFLVNSMVEMSNASHVLRFVNTLLKNGDLSATLSTWVKEFALLKLQTWHDDRSILEVVARLNWTADEIKRLAQELDHIEPNGRADALVALYALSTEGGFRQSILTAVCKLPAVSADGRFSPRASALTKVLSLIPDDDLERLLPPLLELPDELGDAMVMSAFGFAADHFYPRVLLLNALLSRCTGDLRRRCIAAILDALVHVVDPRLIADSTEPLLKELSSDEMQQCRCFLSQFHDELAWCWYSIRLLPFFDDDERAAYAVEATKIALKHYEDDCERIDLLIDLLPHLPAEALNALDGQYVQELWETTKSSGDKAIRSIIELCVARESAVMDAHCRDLLTDIFEGGHEDERKQQAALPALQSLCMHGTLFDDDDLLTRVRAPSRFACRFPA